MNQKQDGLEKIHGLSSILLDRFPIPADFTIAVKRAKLIPKTLKALHLLQEPFVVRRQSFLMSLVLQKVPSVQGNGWVVSNTVKRHRRDGFSPFLVRAQKEERLELSL